MTAPVVSVVIPTTGRECVTRAVLSAALSEGVEAQVIVVLDRPEMADRVASALAPLPASLLVTDGNVGGAKARNIGCENARGKFVAFLDDDDWWEPTKLALQVSAAQELLTRHEHAVISCLTHFHSTRGRTRILPRQQLTAPQDVANYLVQRRGLRHGDGYIPTTSLLVDRALALGEPWDQRWRRHQDWDFTIRAIRRPDTGFFMVPRPLAHVQQGSRGSVSQSLDWRSSLEWFDEHAITMKPRARADFLVAIPARHCLATGDIAELSAVLRRLPLSRCHLAALAVGMTGFRVQIRMRDRRVDQ